jgi:hypothetical protein
VDCFQYYLDKVFGDDYFAPKGSSVMPGDSFSIKGSSVKAGNAIVDLETAMKFSIQATIVPVVGVISAKKDGNPVSLRRLGNWPSATAAWSPPMEFEILAPSGKSTIVGCLRGSYSSGDAALTPRGLGLKAVLGSDGQFWRGPLEGQLAYFGDGIVGVNVDDNGKLLLYPSHALKPPDRGVVGFEAELERFDQAANAGGLPETKTISLSELFPDIGVGPHLELRVRYLKYSSGNLEITLVTNDPNTRLAILCGVDLTVVSRRVVKFDVNRGER